MIMGFNVVHISTLEQVLLVKKLFSYQFTKIQRCIKNQDPLIESLILSVDDIYFNLHFKIQYRSHSLLMYFFVYMLTLEFIQTMLKQRQNK